MCKLSNTNQNYTMQTRLPLEIKEETIVSTRPLAPTPTFIPYNNRQIQVIFNIEELLLSTMWHVWLLQSIVGSIGCERALALFKLA
jgi:hypothetical protein